MKFNSQICTTRDQSERLLALGLKKETADMGWGYILLGDRKREWIEVAFPMEEHSERSLPAWSLHRLWELLPKSIWHDNGLEKKYHPIIEYDFVNYVTTDGMELFDLNYWKDIWESMISCIEWLIKEGYFNKEYLEDDLSRNG